MAGPAQLHQVNQRRGAARAREPTPGEHLTAPGGDEGETQQDSDPAAAVPTDLDPKGDCGNLRPSQDVQEQRKGFWGLN